MENASKALIMAASLLIALMIIGALILMFNNLSSYQETNSDSELEAQIIEFNNQYETYNRNDVRGSDLYSLLNKVIDYNRRKSEVASENDEGKNLKFEAMTIEFKFGNNESRKKITYDNQNRIFTANNYSLNKTTTNTIENDITEKISTIESTYGKSGLTNLTTGIEKLFDKNDQFDQDTAIKLWNTNSNKKVSRYNEINNYKEDIYKYYEYVQFKRAHFKCTGADYNKKTGRIVSMSFEFTGDIE
jgi:type II secretory pathway pseudopilin PulG